jgi:diaminopimelate dehydrogenase
MVAYARAAYRLGCSGTTGCHTVFDIAPALLDIRDGATLRKGLL